MASRAPCAPESCSRSGAARIAFHRLGKVDVDDVAGLDQRIAVALAGPFPVVGQEDDFIGADAGANFEGPRAGDQGMHVVAGPGLTAQSGCLYSSMVDAAGEDIFQLLAPRYQPCRRS